MSRLNYLTDEELALDGIDQELRLLERQATKGVQFDVSQLQVLADYRDRIFRLTAPLPTTAEAGRANNQSFQPALSQNKEAAALRSEEPSIEKLRQSVHKLLDEALA